MKKTWILISVLLVLFGGLLFTSCKKKNQNVPLPEITINETTVQLKYGETHKIDVNVVNAVGSLEYRIADESIISVKDGVITALKVGRTSVAVKVVCNDEKQTTAEFTVNVEVVDELYTITYAANVDGFTKASETISRGGTLRLGEAPLVQGYDFVGWSLTNSLEGEKITELANVLENKTVYAIYKEKIVKKFTISYLANIAGFSKDSEQVDEGSDFTLGTAPSIDGYDFKGWSLSLVLSPITVLENVSKDTTVYAIYEVKQYNVTYVLDGGTYNGEAKVAHGARLTLGTPTKDGFKFLGWTLSQGSTAYVTAITGTKDTTVYANWEKLPTKYTITYHLDNGTYSGETSIEEGKTLRLTTPTKDGYNFLGWTLSQDSTDYVTSVVVNSNLDIYAHWEEIPQGPQVRNITYDLNGGEWNAKFYTPMEIGRMFVSDFSHIDSPDELDTDNMSSTPFGEFFQNAENLAKWRWLLDAVWEVANGADNLKADVADFSKGATIGFYMANFNGYFTSTQHTDTWLGNVSADYSNPLNSQQVTSAGPVKSGEVGVKNYTEGEGLASLATPVYAGFIFDGWVDSQGNKVTSISATQTGDITLKATWKPEPTEFAINYDLAGGEWEVEYYTYDEIIVDFLADFKEATGLEIEASELDTDNMGSSDFGKFCKDQAKFAKWKWLFDAIWLVASGKAEYKSDVADFNDGDVLGFYMANFNGYFTGTQHTDTWLETVGMDFSNVDAVEAVTSMSDPKSSSEGPKTYSKGVGLVVLPVPVRADYVFAGWVDAENNPVTAISAEQTGEVYLKATWEEESGEYTITYDLDGGNWEVQYPTPAQLGSDFVADLNAALGKNISASEIDTDNMGTTSFGNFLKLDTTLAKWGWLLDAVWEVAEGADNYKADVANLTDTGVAGFYMANLNGYFTSTQHTDTWVGSVSADYSVAANSKAVTSKAEPLSDGQGPESYQYGVGVESFPTPAREGYKFLGWFDKKGNQVTSVSTEQKGKLALKARWFDLSTEFTITYMLDGGTYDGETSVVYNNTLVLSNPTRDGFEFLGWSLTEGSTEYVTEVLVLEDVTLYANWEEITIEGLQPITYDLDGGHWQVINYTPSEMGELFKASFKEGTGKTFEPGDLDTNNMSSTLFGNFFKNDTYKTKWMWLLQAVWEVGKGTAAQKPDTADFGTTGVVGFYLANFNGYFTGTQHTDTWIKSESANYADPDISLAVTVKGPAKAEVAGAPSYIEGEGLAELVSPVRSEYVFTGWVDSEGHPVTSISTTQKGALTLKATWEHETIAENINFTNMPEDGIRLYDTLQLEWVVTPDDAVNKNVSFYAVTPSVLTVSETGLVKAVSLGTGTIRVKLESNPDFEKFIEINVWSGNYFDAYYDTVSYVEVDGSIGLVASYIDKDHNSHDVTWSSLNSDIATVDATGRVTGLAAGVATIRATYEDKHFDFVVTVLEAGLSEAVQFVLDNHISNAKTTYNLGIGDGNPEYYYDVVSGVNNLLFDNLKIDRRYYDQLPSGTKNYGEMTSVEFITVHYTGNMKYSADADNNADYFNDLDYRASIHFVTGRTNLSDLTGQSSGYNADAYYAFAGLNEKYAGWHATNGDPCVWDDTGLTVLEGDPATPLISISNNMKYTINGRETTITIPTAPDGYTVNGNVLTVDGVQYSVFNQYGLRAKVVDGKYYLARTHWGTQRTPKALCTCGGNRNSIGIESCVDKGSDLVHTWHVTAQLVAKLLVDNNLGLDRVVGHHFFSGKDCPQPLLERDMKLWYEFMDMVAAEYELLTTYKDVTITAEAVNDDGILRNNGLLVQDTNAHCVTYEVTVNEGGVEKKITLATCVESCYKYDGERRYASLQTEGFTVI